MPNTFFFSKGRRASECRGDRSQEKEKNWKTESKKETKEDSGSVTTSRVPSWCQNTPLDSRDVYVAGEYGVTDMVLLYITLVSDGAIPPGFLAEFVTLEQALKLSSKRAINIAANRSDAEAERLLFIDKKRRDMQALTSSAASDQLVLAAELKPRKFRSKWQRIVFEGPTARKDMEDAERARWGGISWRSAQTHRYSDGSVAPGKPIEFAGAWIGT